MKDRDNKFYVYRFRLYPNAEQVAYLDEQMSYNRFVYNFFLERATHLYKTHNIKFNYYEFKKILPLLKKGFSFLKEANSQSLQASLKDLDDAFQKFFKKQAGYPNFKKKGVYSSIVIPQSFEIKDSFINIPKLKTAIKVKFHRKVYEAVKSISISKTTSGKYYVNMLVEKFAFTPYIPKKVVGISTGIDLGLKDFAIITTGTSFDNKESFKIPNPKYLLKSQKRLIKLSRQLDRKVHKRSKQDKTTPSKNYIKFKNKLSKLHEHIFNQRNDFLHKLSSRTVNDSQVIVLEDLNIKGMVKNGNLSKPISDVSWSKFNDMLEYKASWYGRQVFKVNRFYPSSKTCSTPDCGYIHKDLKLSERFWICPQCGAVHDRDVNASINLFLEGLTILKNTPGTAELTPLEYALTGIQSIGYSNHTMRQEAYQFIDR
ncbi:MAG: transposase [Candidatus Acidulodesulfobacterium acidiphilum]|uniref:Transposase n=1 Tax=Candidatus Acidulodesulfobacterium acidiphilum TaxID=2597224 RepID=A0A520XG78_9DELT|nr:MAG: transposase [Candidatus Acidulodesulfobacterium acidiphilum]